MIDGMITVRFRSTRLPGKCLLKFDNGLTVLEHVIDRCRNCGIEPIVASTIDDIDDVVELFAKSTNVKFFRGSVDDKMHRWFDAAQHFNVDSFVVVDCDDPFFDHELTRSTYDLLHASNADYVVPDLRAYLGSHNMAVRTSALERSVAMKTSTSTEMIERFIHDDAKIERFWIDDVRELEQHIRLTLDYEEDWWLIRTVHRALGPMATRSDILRFFDSNRGLTLVNEFRIHDWLEHRGEK